MSGKGNCYNIAAVETFFKYINDFYNARRGSSAPGWKSPIAFGRMVAYTKILGGTKARQVHRAEQCFEDY